LAPQNQPKSGGSGSWLGMITAPADFKAMGAAEIEALFEGTA
jgi:hypothetical protein